MILTAHQPNLLPGLSVIRKIEASDAVLWLDRVQFSKNGWTNRNRLPDGTTLTLPVSHNHDTPIDEVGLAPEAGRACRKIADTLRQRYSKAPYFIAQIPDLIEHGADFKRLAPLNLCVARLMLAGFGIQIEEYRESVLNLDGPISDKLAHVCELLGADTYLSGPSGKDYLDEAPFRDRGIAVKYHQHHGPNHSAVHDLMTRGR